VQRVSVVGSSGSGKTTVAARLAVRLGIPHVELDAIYHQPGWVPLEPEAFRTCVAHVVAGDAWIVDGNYSVVRDLVWARADTIVWLDLPRREVMWQITTRSIGRVVRRTDLWNGNRERWRNLLTWDPDESAIRHSWQNHRKNHDRYEAARRDPRHEHLRFIQLRSRREVGAFLEG
jgi:adenylate kinase family enzyme